MFWCVTRRPLASTTLWVCVLRMQEARGALIDKTALGILLKELLETPLGPSEGLSFKYHAYGSSIWKFKHFRIDRVTENLIGKTESSLWRTKDGGKNNQGLTCGPMASRLFTTIPCKVHALAPLAGNCPCLPLVPA